MMISDWLTNLIQTTPWPWVGLLVLILLGVVGGLIAGIAMRLLIRARNRFVNPPYTKKIKASLKGAAQVLGFGFTVGTFDDALQVAPKQIDIANRAIQGATIFHTVDRAVEVVQIFGTILLILALWDVISDRILASTSGHSARAERLLVPVMSKMIRAVIVVIGALIAIASITQINITAMITSLGIGGVAIALAAKDSVENIFGSFTVLFDMPFKLGDWVKIDKYEGVIEQINIRSTRIRAFDGSLIMLPNANLIRAAVQNVDARNSRRQKIALPVLYHTPPQSIQDFLDRTLAMLNAIGETKPDASTVVIDQTLPQSLIVQITCFLHVPTYADEVALKNRIVIDALKIGTECGVLFGSAITTETSSG